MRDLHLRHTLKTLARDASEVFGDLVEAGQEIPYEIGEPTDGFAFSQFQPLTARFIRDNAGSLVALDGYREAIETMKASDLAGSYLEGAGIAPPADPTERATLAVTYFLARLWDGQSDFEIDEDRFYASIGEIEDCAEPEAGEIEAIVPLVGFQMSTSRLDLDGASIVRADAVDVPSEAARADRSGGAAWEPTFLISARVSLDPDGGLGGAGDRVARTFERVALTLRLFRPGGVGLGPHGWVRVSGDRWRRISTGAGRPRGGGYRLTESDVEAIADLSRAVNLHPRRIERLNRALLRFEAGLDRRGAVDALNDHLLALRFLLEGEGPAGVGLPMRVAALTSEVDGRSDAKAVVEQAISTERQLWSGEPVSRDGMPGPSELAAGVEDLLRTILRRAVTGELGSDLRAAADEALLADGLAFGEGSASELGGDTEWDLETVEIGALAGVGDEDPELLSDDPVADELMAEAAFDADDADDVIAYRGPGKAAETPRVEASRLESVEPISEPDVEEPIVAYEPVQPELPSEHETFADAIADDGPAGSPAPVAPVARWAPPLPAPSQVSRPTSISLTDEGPIQEAPEREPTPTATSGGWLDEVEGDAPTMDFPARSNHLEDLARPPMDREEVRARVEYLFPRTETDWTVGSGSQQRAS